MGTKTPYFLVSDGGGRTIRMDFDYKDINSDDCRNAFKAMMTFLNFHPDTMDSIIPDCDECCKEHVRIADQKIDINLDSLVKDLVYE